MTEKRLGVGVLGLHEGRTLLAGLAKPVPAAVGQASEQIFRSSHARAVAGCDRDLAKVEAARAEMPDLFYTSDYEAMLAREDIAIIAIYTPDPMHGQHIVQAFEAGKHVICTKPLVASLEDARSILEVGRRLGRRLLVGQSTRFFESFKRQRKAFEAGEVGRVELADAHYIHRMDWYYRKSGWAVTDADWVYLGMSHPLDLLCWYLGPIETVQAMAIKSAMAHHHAVVSNDVYIVNVRSHSGAVGRAMGHYGLHELPTARNAIELMLYGSAGTSLAQYHDMRYLHTGPNGAEVCEDFLYEKRAYYFNNEVHGMHYGEFANYADYFARAILRDEPNSPDLAEGVETFCLMEAVRRSSATGEAVLLAPLLKEAGL